MKKLILLRGNSGSGKSTTARALQQKFGHGTMLIFQDVVRREMLYVRDGENTRAVSLLLELVKYGRQNCDIVILEGILKASWYRELFEWIGREYGGDVHAYYFELPFEETLLRHKQKPNCNDFGEKEMREWWNEKDYIGTIPEKSLTKELGMDETVAMIYNEVNGNNGDKATT